MRRIREDVIRELRDNPLKVIALMVAMAAAAVLHILGSPLANTVTAWIIAFLVSMTLAAATMRGLSWATAWIAEVRTRNG